MANYVKIAIDKYGVTEKLKDHQSSYILPDGKLVDLDDKGHKDLGDNMFSRYADALRIVNTPWSLAVDFMAETIPTLAQIRRVNELAVSRELTFTVIDFEDTEKVGKTSTNLGNMMTTLEEFYNTKW